MPVLPHGIRYFLNENNLHGLRNNAMYFLITNLQRAAKSYPIVIIKTLSLLERPRALSQWTSDIRLCQVFALVSHSN